MSKTINTRFLLRYDTWENWNSEQGKAVELLQGEIAIAAIGGTEASGSNQATTAPTILFKVGPGKFGELKWVSALAADVYGWAKETSLPVVQQGTGNVVASISWDVTANEGKGGLTYTTASVATAEGLKDLGDALEALTKRVTALETLVGKQLPDGITSTTVIDYVKEAADSKVGSVTAKDKSIIVEGTATAPEVKVNISTDSGNALSLTDTGLKVIIPDVPEYSIAKADNSGDYAAVYNLTKDGEKIGASINIPKDMVVSSGSVVELVEGEVEDLAAGTYIKLVLANTNNDALYISVGSLIEYVTSGSAEGDNVIININEEHKVTATLNNTLLTKINNAVDSTTVNTAIGTKINELDSDIKASDPDADGRVSVLTKVVQTDGKLTDKAEVKLSKIATTGNVNDLEQTDGDYVIFYGGDSFGWDNPPVIE